MNAITSTTDFHSSYGLGRETNVISHIPTGNYFQEQLCSVKRKGRTAIIYTGKIINTASESVEFNVDNSKEVYINLLGESQSKHLKVIGLFNTVKTLFADKKSDEAVVCIFDIIDDWYIYDEIKFDDLFDIFYGKEFNEDIYIALLASTVTIKNNQYRKRYFEYVMTELSKLYPKDELEMVLLGL